MLPAYVSVFVGRSGTGVDRTATRLLPSGCVRGGVVVLWIRRIPGHGRRRVARLGLRLSMGFTGPSLREWGTV